MKNIVLISCSNGLTNNEDFNELLNILNSFKLNVTLSKALFKVNNETISAKERAKELTKYLLDEEVDFIFDVSGGDLSNEVLNYLDFDIIKNSEKYYFGYSDLTTLLNAFSKKTNIRSVNYQIRNIIKNKERLFEFKGFIEEANEDLFKFDFDFIRGSSLSGKVLGGNIRCLLKLAGTDFMPDFENNILFLEAMGGDFNKISTFAAQLNQIGAFKKIKGLILGTFLEFEEKSTINVEDIFLNYLDHNIPIAKTKFLGHLSNSKAIKINEYINLNK